jgi:hypothetical protein
MKTRPVATFVAICLCFSMISESALAGLDSKKAQYVGGTVSAIPANAEAVLNLSGDSMTG